MSNSNNELQERIKFFIENKSNFLDISFLNLTKFPEEIYELYWINELNISNNYIKNIDAKKFKNLSKIHSLNLSNNLFNYFDGLPFEIGNNLSIIHLDISNNNFIKLPSELRNIKHLISMKFDGNSFERNIPLELNYENIDAILNYQEELELSKYVIPLYEGKLIFIGNGDVGKTSLVKKLIDYNFKLKIGEELTTKGISIKNWNLVIQNKLNSDYDWNEEEEEEEDEYFFEDDKQIINQEVNVELNIWDFGGQEIYHSTHQFFLTKRSIYILVWETRKDEVYNTLDYWLSIVSILGSNSPVIVVQNKCESRQQELNKSDLKEKFPNIIDFHQISCLNSRGIDKLRNTIKITVENLPHLGDKLPKAWKDIKEYLLEVDSDYITYEEYLEICEKFNISIKRAEFISEYLHDLGVIIHFKNDYLLSGIVILNPEWATSAVYSLLDQERIISNNGKFNEKDLPLFWNNKNYPTHKYPQIMRLMKKFELCFNILGTDNYILPELLPDENKNIVAKGIKNHWEMWYEYRYSFIPSGIITRLICKINPLIVDLLFSKFSIVIRFENSECLITQDIFEKKISIFIYGGSNSETLALVKSSLADIHHSLNLHREKEYFEYLSCFCDDCYKSNLPNLFQLKTINRFLEMGKETIECQKSGEPVNIRNVLKGYRASKYKIKIITLLINACLKLQGSILTIKSDENSKNTFLKNYLSHFPEIIVKDQSLWGKSPTGKSPGEIDIFIENLAGNPLAIIEALRLDRYKSYYISSHINKIFDYDVNGLKENFIVIYSEVSDFLSLWIKYINHVDRMETKFKQKQEFQDCSEKYNCNAEMKVGITTYDRNGMEVKIFHLFINLN